MKSVRITMHGRHPCYNLETISQETEPLTDDDHREAGGDEKMTRQKQQQQQEHDDELSSTCRLSNNPIPTSLAGVSLLSSPSWHHRLYTNIKMYEC